MVGGFPIKRAPAPVKVPTVAEDVEFDEEGRRRITAPIVPAPRPPATYARPLPPMPGALKPGGLPLRPVAPKQVQVPPPLKTATAAPTAVKRPPPPTPHVRKQQPQYLDPNDVDLGSYSPNWGKR